MLRRYLAFDLETAKVLPPEVTDLLRHRPLGIACAAAVKSDGGEPITWFGAGAAPASRLSRQEAASLVDDLMALVRNGYTLLSWNGLSFDFNVLSEESGLLEECAELALNHVDMMFHAVCTLGHYVSLQKAAEGLGIPGKPAGMSGSEAPSRWADGCHEEVLAYNVQDVRLALEIAQACERRHELVWITRRGTLGRMPLSDGWLTVQECLDLPLPDTSWMSDPPTREDFFSWAVSAGNPGTGIGAQERIRSSSHQGSPGSRQTGPAEASKTSVVFSLDEEGKIVAAWGDGRPLDAEDRRLAIAENRGKVEQWLSAEVREANELSTRLGRIHLNTPPPVYRSQFEEDTFPKRRPEKPELVTFQESEPTAPAALQAGILDKMVPGRARRKEARNTEALAQFKAELSAWRRGKKIHEERQSEKLQRFEADLEQWEREGSEFAARAREEVARQEERLRTDTDLMVEVFQSKLTSLEWPLETNVSFELRADGALLMLDVDLPKVEDFPTSKASLAANKRRVLKRRRSPAEVRREYASHVHGIGLCLLGEAFSSLPTVKTIVVAAYSKRLDRATGRSADEYLYSVKVDRDSFGAIDFKSLAKVDPVEALGAFEIRRKMSKTGLFKPVEPFSLQELEQEREAEGSSPSCL